MNSRDRILDPADGTNLASNVLSSMLKRISPNSNTSYWGYSTVRQRVASERCGGS
ncbi:MAG: hypothetical protein M0008_01695 [Actinomycetota bacterium]|nr:hypothetical protein [Actinomycetota bacterium]